MNVNTVMSLLVELVLQPQSLQTLFKIFTPSVVGIVCGYVYAYVCECAGINPTWINQVPPIDA